MAKHVCGCEVRKRYGGERYTESWYECCGCAAFGPALPLPNGTNHEHNLLAFIQGDAASPPSGDGVKCKACGVELGADR